VSKSSSSSLQGLVIIASSDFILSQVHLGRPQSLFRIGLNLIVLFGNFFPSFVENILSIVVYF
jgi:hypothetical protein